MINAEEGTITKTRHIKNKTVTLWKVSGSECKTLTQKNFLNRKKCISQKEKTNKLISIKFKERYYE